MTAESRFRASFAGLSGYEAAKAAGDWMAEEHRATGRVQGNWAAIEQIYGAPPYRLINEVRVRDLGPPGAKFCIVRTMDGRRHLVDQKKTLELLNAGERTLPAEKLYYVPAITMVGALAS